MQRTNATNREEVEKEEDDNEKPEGNTPKKPEEELPTDTEQKKTKYPSRNPVLFGQTESSLEFQGGLFIFLPS